MTPKKYNELNELLAEHSRLSADLSRIEADVNSASLEAALPLLPFHAEAKAKLADLESKLRIIATENPDLFPDEKKIHQTPFGALSFRKSSRLEIEDESLAIVMILSACRRELERAARKAEPPRFTAETLLRTRQEPNLEALETFTDDVLKSLFGVERIHEEKFSVKPLQVKADKLARKPGKPLPEAA